MEQKFSIGKIASFFQIPASTLRYWEESGLLAPEKNSENDYRFYSVDDLMTISDILFYKKLGLSLKQIGEMEQTETTQHQQLLERKVGELQQRKKEIDIQLQKLRYHLSAIDTLRQLEKTPLQVTDIDTACIVPFELVEIDKLRQYIDNPYLYSRVQHSNCPQEGHRGLTVPEALGNLLPPEQILWRKTGSRYIACLMKEEVTEGYPNNLPNLLEAVQAEYRTGYIISRFLLCAQENGKLYDFYKTFIEIL